MVNLVLTSRLSRSSTRVIPLAATYGPGRAPSSSGWRTKPAFIRPSSRLLRRRRRVGKELGAAGEGVVVSQVVPFPRGHLAQGRRRLPGRPNGPRCPLSPGLVSLEGYLSGRLAAAVLVLAGRTRPVPACCWPSTRSAGSISAEASSPSERRCGMHHLRFSSPSFGRTDPSRPSTGCDAVMERQGLEPAASAC
jgi:hypothetical protein